MIASSLPRLDAHKPRRVRFAHASSAIGCNAAGKLRPRGPFPKTGSRKNNSEKCGVFLAEYLRSFSDHLSPASHHNFTIKKPQFTTTFSQKTLQKHRSTISKNKRCTFIALLK